MFTNKVHLMQAGTAGPCLTPPLATPAGYTPIPFAFLPLEHLQ